MMLSKYVVDAQCGLANDNMICAITIIWGKGGG